MKSRVRWGMNVNSYHADSYKVLTTATKFTNCHYTFVCNVNTQE